MQNADRSAVPEPVLLRAEPQLFVRDITASCEFYRDKLGFSVLFLYGEPPFYAGIARDGAYLNPRCVKTPVMDPQRCAAEDLLAASITLEDAKPLFLAYQAAGVPFHQTLRSEPWGARTFIVRDPDGNLVLFAGKGE
jgi:catechol 2,3-dioxygenase-like lactoylglutathione lyase family enzyme